MANMASAELTLTNSSCLVSTHSGTGALSSCAAPSGSACVRV